MAAGIGAIQTAAAAPAGPTISSIAPDMIPVNSTTANLRIQGSGLLGTSTAPCSGPAETVTWESTTLMSFGTTSTGIDATVPGSLLTVVGFYNITVSVNQINGNACQTLTATGTVEVTGPPMLSLSTHNVNFATPAGVLPTPQLIGIRSTSGTLSYAASVSYTSGGPTNWLCLSATASGCPSSASGNVTAGNPVAVTVAAAPAVAGFGTGRYTANVNFTAGSQSQSVAVTLNVNSLIVQSVMVFGALAGPTAPAGPQDSQTLVVGATSGSATFSYSVQQGGVAAGPSTCTGAQATATASSNTLWLVVNGSINPQGTGTTGQPLTLSVQPTGFAPGTYVNYLNLTPNGTVATTVVSVYLVVESPQQSIGFSYTSGGSLPADQRFNQSSACGVTAVNLQVGYSSDQNWLAAVLNSAGSGFTIAMTASPSASMAPGVYYGVVAITDTSGEALIYLCTLTVNAAVKTSTATLLSASPNPAVTGQMVSLSATVSPPAATGSVVFSDGGSSLGSVSLSSGAAALPAVFAPGSHTLTAAYSGDPSYASSASSPVTLKVNTAMQSQYHGAYRGSSIADRWQPCDPHSHANAFHRNWSSDFSGWRRSGWPGDAEQRRGDAFDCDVGGGCSHAHRILRRRCQRLRQ